MKKNALLMIVIRGLSLLISLAYVPIMLNSVNRADYGILMTLTSIVQWVGLLDIGLGNGLRNKLSEYLAKGEITKARESVSSCYGALSIYVLVIVIVFMAVSPFLSWRGILNSPESDELELMKLADVVFVAFCFQFVVNLITSVLYAYQTPALTSIINLAAQAVSFVVIVVMIKVFSITSILEIGTANCIIPPLTILLSSFVLYSGKLKDVAPSFRLINIKSVNPILSLGMRFFVLQIITIVLYQANNILIAQSTDQETVVVYNIAYKYISVLSMVFVMLVSPLWSATTEAYTKGDILWIRKTAKLLSKVWVLMMICGMVMVAASRFVYGIWLGKDTIDIPYITTSLILVYLGFEMLYKIYGAILNGIGKLRAQMLITAVLAAVFAPMALYLGKRLGLTGVMIANVVVQLANYAWSRYQYEKIISGTATGIWNQ